MGLGQRVSTVSLAHLQPGAWYWWGRECRDVGRCHRRGGRLATVLFGDGTEDTKAGSVDDASPHQ